MTEISQSQMGILAPIILILFGLIALAAVVVVGWVIPIQLGLREARHKNYSTLWMLFGIHPFGGWIAFIVLHALPGRQQCYRCGGFVALNWKLCPFCQAPMPPQPEQTPPTAPPWTPPPPQPPPRE